jgi:hypothetical protein
MSLFRDINEVSLTIMQNTLQEINPYVHLFKQLGNSGQEEREVISLHPLSGI